MSIIEHVKTCVIDDDETFVYHTAEQSTSLIFNSIYVLVGVSFDGKNYVSPDTLTSDEKVNTSAQISGFLLYLYLWVRSDWILSSNGSVLWKY